MVKLINERLRDIFKKEKEVQPLTIRLEPRTLMDCAVSCPLGVVDETPYSVYYKESPYERLVHEPIVRYLPLGVSFITLQEAQEWIVNHCLTTAHKIKYCHIVREYPAEYNI